MAFKTSTGLRNKLLGLRNEMISNGGFPSDATGWTASNATLSSVAGGQSGNCLQISETGGASPGQGYQEITTVVGRRYEVVVYFKKGTADSGRFQIGTSGDPDAIYDSGALTDADWTVHRHTFYATATTTRVTLQSDDTTASETSLFDGVSCKPLQVGVKELFEDGSIRFYSGSQPASADDAATGTLLVAFTVNGDGATPLNFDDPAAGSIAKPSGVDWKGTAVSTGTAGWFLVCEEGDDPTQSSTTKARLSGTIGTSGADFNISNTTITSGSVQTIGAFQLNLAAS